jgi:hypothetical protein
MAADSSLLFAYSFFLLLFHDRLTLLSMEMWLMKHLVRYPIMCADRYDINDVL